MKKRAKTTKVVDVNRELAVEQKPMLDDRSHGGYSPHVEHSLSNLERMIKIADDAAEREARFRRWDEIEARARKNGLSRPSSRPVPARAPQAESSLSPAERSRIEDEAFWRSSPEPLVRTPVAEEEVVVRAKPKSKPKKRSDLVLRLEAAKKLSHARARA